MLRFRYLALALGLITLVGACTNNPYPEEQADEKVLYLSFGDAPKTLDPATAYTTSAHAITGKVYDTLLGYHYLLRPYELIPGLAEAVPEPEPHDDGRVSYTFDLRPDLLYQEDPCFTLQGTVTRNIVAADIAYQLARIADPQVNSPVTDPFSNIDGFQEFSQALVERRKTDEKFAALRSHEQYQELGGIAGVRTPSPRILQITLHKPYPQILYWFAMPFTTPVPWEAVEYYDGEEGRDRFADHPVSSGPFILSEYDKQTHMVLTKNEYWYGVRHPEWNAPAATYPSKGEPEDKKAGLLSPDAVGKSLPFASRIEYHREKESIPAFNKFLQGYYDASGIIRESFDKVIQGDRLSPEMQRLGMRLDKTVEPAIYYLGFNMDDELVGAKGGDRARKLRQAMSLVIDAKEYTRLFMNSRGVPADSLLPPGIFGHDPDYTNPYRKVDIPRAKQLLKEAGYPGGIDPKTDKPLKLTFDAPDTSADAILRFNFWVNQWRKIGLDVEVAATSYNKFQEKVRDGAYQLFQWGWVADYPDPENFMFLLSCEMARSKTGGPNTANYCNPEYDELFAEMKAMKNSDERMAIIRQMLSIVERDRPWIELFYPETYMLYHSWVHNVKPAGLSTAVTKYYDVEPQLRERLRDKWNEPVVWPAWALVGLMALVIAPGVVTFFRERQ